RTVNAGVIVAFTATAGDADLPANPLSFSLINPPTGATIDSGSGAFYWRPTITQVNTTNTIQVQVADNGSPNMTDTKAFTVVVNPITPVVLTTIGYDTTFKVHVSGPT